MEHDEKSNRKLPAVHALKSFKTSDFFVVPMAPHKKLEIREERIANENGPGPWWMWECATSPDVHFESWSELSMPQ